MSWRAPLKVYLSIIREYLDEEIAFDPMVRIVNSVVGEFDISRFPRSRTQMRAAAIVDELFFTLESVPLRDTKASQVAATRARLEAFRVEIETILEH